MPNPTTQLIRVLAVLVTLPIIGTLGFMLIEHWDFIDALYMSFITLSTVGYEVVHPLSDSGKIFVVVYLGTGLSFFIYSLTQIGEMAVRGDLQQILGGRRMTQQIASLQQHAIICGLGRMGRAIAEELQSRQEAFVAIDIDPERVSQAQSRGWLCIKGDAADDVILKQAGIESARCLSTVLPHDADNLFTIMSARLLNKTLILITRAASDSSVAKLKRAGANRVVSPYTTGAVKMAQLMIHPELEDFIEIFADRGIGIDLSVVHLDKNSALLGRTIREINEGEKEIMIIGHKRKGEKLDLPPPLDKALQDSDVLVAAGKSVSLARLFSPNSAR